ncbi:MAG: M28 family peptidase, partial [Promethearchaeota archaeon]
NRAVRQDHIRFNKDISSLGSSSDDDNAININTQLEFNACISYNYIKKQLSFGYRVPGSIGHEQAGDWIKATLGDFTDTILIHNFVVSKGGDSAGISCQNIIGVLNPDKKNIIIFGAHWDSRAVSEKDTVNRSEPFPAANDGGSGVAVLMELARVLYPIRVQINAQVWFMFIDAEDQGYSRDMYGIYGWDWCEGSRAFVDDMDLFVNKSQGQSVSLFFLLDMVGGTSLQFIKETHSNENLRQKVFEIGQDLGYSYQFPESPKSMSIIDDHVYFANKGIPTIDLIIDFVYGKWTYHHTHQDNLEHIDIKSLNCTGRTVESFIKTYYLNKTSSQLVEWDNSQGRNGISQILGQLLYALLIIGGGLGLGILGISLIRVKHMREIKRDLNQGASNIKQNKEGLDKEGLDKEGLDKEGLDKEGLDKEG